MKKEILFSLFFLLMALPLAAQKINGKIVSSDNNTPIARATCKLVGEKNALLAYCITDKNGRFTINTKPNAVALVVTAMNYAAKRIDISKCKEGMSIAMKEENHELNEVIVRAPAISRKKDTLNYNVASFLSAEDMHLEDVLKKMPGIEVTEDGSVRYQGKSINRFNIEGQNLLGNRYNQATRNMPVKAVATVQVMENNQPIRALEDKVFSDQASLNIKLKKEYKFHPFGEVTIGGGGFDKLLWNNYFTLMNVGKKAQTLITAKMNNLGYCLGRNATNSINLSNLDDDIFLPSSLVRGGTLRTLPMKPNRYIDNKSFEISANQLFKLSEYSNIVVNLTYIDEHEEGKDSTHNEYNIGERIVLNETNSLKSYYQKFAPIVKYELNEKKLYLLNEVKGNITKTYTENNIVSNKDSLLTIAERKPAYVSNHLKAILTTARRIYSLNSTARYYNAEETINQPYAQKLRREEFTMDNKVGTSFILFSNKLRLNYVNKLFSQSLHIENSVFKSSIQSNIIMPAYSFDVKKVHLNVDAPINFIQRRVPWKIEQPIDNRLFLSPSVSVSYHPNSKITLGISGGYNENSGKETLFGHSYFSNYRTREDSISSFGWDKQWRSSFSFTYMDIIHLFSFNLSTFASWKHSDYLTNYNYTNEISTSNPIWKDNFNRSFSVITNMKKSFFGKCSLSPSFSYFHNEYAYAQNNEEFKIKANSLSASLMMLVYLNKWINITYDGFGAMSWQSNNNAPQMKSFRNNVILFYKPCKKFDLKLTGEYNAVEVRKDKYETNFFLDFNANYYLAKRMRLMMNVTNLFNQHRYVNASYNATNYHYYSKLLRGREIFASIMFSY